MSAQSLKTYLEDERTKILLWGLDRAQYLKTQGAGDNLKEAMYQHWICYYEALIALTDYMIGRIDAGAADLLEEGLREENAQIRALYARLRTHLDALPPAQRHRKRAVLSLMKSLWVEGHSNQRVRAEIFSRAARI